MGDRAHYWAARLAAEHKLSDGHRDSLRKFANMLLAHTKGLSTDEIYAKVKMMAEVFAKPWRKYLPGLKHVKIKTPSGFGEWK